MAISPGVYTQITDKSGYTPENLVAGFFGLFPIASARGEDNKLKLKTGLSSALKEYAEPRFSRYGLSYLFATNWLRGGSAAYVARLMPEDAKYANVQLKLEDVSGSLPAPASSWAGFFSESTTFGSDEFTSKDGVYYKNTSGGTATGEFDAAAWTAVTVNFNSASSYTTGTAVVHRKSLYVASSNVTAGAPFNSSDWTLIYYVPAGHELVKLTTSSSESYASTANIDADLSTESSLFAVFRPIGRGLDYNKLGMTIKLNTALADTYSFAMYDIQFFDTDSNGFKTLIESIYSVSFDPSATDLTGESLFISDVINKYSDTVRVAVNSENLEDLLYPSVTLFNDPEALVEDIYSLDVLGNTIPGLVEFKNGSEGSLITAQGRFNVAEYETLVRNLFAGTLDPAITNFKEIPAKVVFDAGYTVPTKVAMSAFTNSLRTDIFAYIAAPIAANEEQELIARGDALSMDNYRASLQAGNFEIYDEFTGRYVRVPALYSVVNNISVSWKQTGVHVPVAGYNVRGTIAGVKAGSLAYNPNRVYADMFYLKQINPIIQDPSGLYRMGTLTMQKKQSALSNESVNIFTAL